MGASPPEVTQRDALGLTAEQRAEAAWNETEEAFRRESLALMDQMRENWAAFDALPAGTMINCDVCRTYHPVEMYR